MHEESKDTCLATIKKLQFGEDIQTNHTTTAFTTAWYRITRVRVHLNAKA